MRAPTLIYPRVQLKIKDRVVIDSKDFTSEIKNSILTFKLENSDTVPRAINTELVAIGGWKLNVVSLIHAKSNSEIIVNGWKSLETLVPMDRLLIPFLYIAAVDYLRFRFSNIEPSWTGLLRFSYWYERCLNLNDNNFQYKQTEIKRKILKPLRNAEKAINNKGRNFIPAMEQLRKEIASYTSELQFAVLASDCGKKVTFLKKHDFILDLYPSEVKSMYSRWELERNKGKTKFKIYGQILGKKVDPYKEFSNFIFSRKTLGHIQKAYNQGGKLIFLNVTYTFASHLMYLMYLLSKEKGTTFSFYKALDNAINIHKKNKEKLPVIVVSSNSSYEHQILSFVVPMPLELFKKSN
jgi:hypothetical protein